MKLTVQPPVQLVTLKQSGLQYCGGHWPPEHAELQIAAQPPPQFLLQAAKPRE